ncbi:N-acetylmuramoyl-L-alanine amidase family protein [Pontibacter beigongshangensis]|uniref:N-acetylmuramoyl-L-alanine amidase family protein n=1 Tax=Pontibacter beigongshangensis TaxID=2574733 RepID=UPI00164EDBF6|nr:N-acetylmuramoyl-L-alanine amidase [Pontibacter beigongshangensis]
MAVKTFLFLLLFISATLQVFAQQVHQKVVAKAGDGIFTLLRRHGLNYSEYASQFLELNRDNLGKDNSLFVGKTYLLPHTSAGGASAAAASAASGTSAAAAPASSARVLNVPLFGPKYARVEIKDQQLSGAVYYISAGHGGPDPGAIGKYGSHSLGEDEYAYDVSIRLARALMEHGATVYMIVQDPDDGIRDESILKMDRDEVHYPNKVIPLNHKQRLRERTAIVNSLYAKHKSAYQRMLAIHVDSRSKSQKIDVFFYHHENSPTGKKLAESIHQTFTSKYKRYQPNRAYSGSVSERSTLYVVKNSRPPTVFIELGNIRNNLDQRRFVIPSNRQALANWIKDGIVADYKNRGK